MVANQHSCCFASQQPLHARLLLLPLCNLLMSAAFSFYMTSCITATHQVLMHASSLMQVSPELSPPPPPPGTVAVNVTGGTSGSSPIVTVNLSPPPPGTVAVDITGGTNGSSPTVTVNATAGPASPGVSPVVGQSPPLASPLAPTGSPLSHCQLTWTLTLSHSYGVHIMYLDQLHLHVLALLHC